MTLVYDKPKPNNCVGKTQPGTRVLYDYCRSRWPLGNTGTYNCRTTAMGTPSCHAEGRAGDLGVEVKQNKPLGDEVANWLVANADALGVQGVIWNHKAWGFGRWSEGWRSYSGDDPHTGHIHFEQNWSGAKNLKRERIEAIAQPAPVPQPEEDDMPIIIWRNGTQAFMCVGNKATALDGDEAKKLEKNEQPYAAKSMPDSVFDALYEVA